MLSSLGNAGLPKSFNLLKNVISAKCNKMRYGLYIEFSVQLDYFSREQFSSALCLPRVTVHIGMLVKCLIHLLQNNDWFLSIFQKVNNQVFYKQHYEAMDLSILWFQSIAVTIFIDMQIVPFQLVGTSSSWLLSPLDTTAEVFDHLIAF